LPLPPPAFPLLLFAAEKVDLSVVKPHQFLTRRLLEYNSDQVL